MTSLSVRQQATQLLERFTEAQAYIEELGPFEQIIETRKLLGEIQVLEALQKRVDAAWARNQNAISKEGDEDFMAITEKVEKCSAIRDKIKLNSWVALKIMDIGDDMTIELVFTALEVYSSSGPLRISSEKWIDLVTRVSRLTETVNINTGNLEMLENLKLSCNGISRQIEQLNAHPSSSEPNESDEIVSEKLFRKEYARL